MSDKPKSFIDSLGPDVVFTEEVMENDPWAQTTLKEIGKVVGGGLKAKGLKYVGSFAVHIYRSEANLITGNYEMDSINQFALTEASEQITMLAFNRVMSALRKHFNPGLKSGFRDGR